MKINEILRDDSLSSGQQPRKLVFKDIASPNVYFVHEDATVSLIAQQMATHWTDTIFVKNDEEKVTGIITDGIIWNLIAKENDPTDPRTLKAKEIMFKHFLRVDWDTPVESIEKIREVLENSKNKIQRIGIIKDGTIIGLVRKKFIEHIKRYSRNFSFSLK